MSSVAAPIRNAMIHSSSLSSIFTLSPEARRRRASGESVKILDKLEEWIIAFLMGAATLLIFVAVLHRYAAGLSIPGVQDVLLKIDLSWAQELCIYMFVWMAKFGAAYG